MPVIVNRREGECQKCGVNPGCKRAQSLILGKLEAPGTKAPPLSSLCTQHFVHPPHGFPAWSFPPTARRWFSLPLESTFFSLYLDIRPYDPASI